MVLTILLRVQSHIKVCIWNHALPEAPSVTINFLFIQQHKEFILYIPMTELNMVELIKKTPITRLSHTSQSLLLITIQEKFTTSEQQLFITRFYCFLNYYAKIHFGIDLDYVWEWLGFTQRDNAKKLLENQFQLDIDYKLQDQKIMMTIDTFKLFCLKASTEKASQIHEYYIKLEETCRYINKKLTLRRELYRAPHEKGKKRI